MQSESRVYELVGQNAQAATAHITMDSSLHYQDLTGLAQVEQSHGPRRTIDALEQHVAAIPVQLPKPLFAGCISRIS